MSVAITHKVKRMLQRLAVCPECGTPAKLIVTQKLIAWSCERCLKARAGDGEAQTPAPVGHMKDPRDPATPPVVGAVCIVRVKDSEVPLRTAYWCSGTWRNPHTAMPIIPAVLSFCPINEAADALEGPDSELGAALDGMANRGMISAEQAEHARRRISAQKGVAV